MEAVSQPWLERFLANEWYVVLPAYVAGLLLIGAITYFLAKKSWSAVYFVWLSVFLLVGLIGYSMSPVISVFSITAGFILAFITIFGGALTK